MTSSRASGTAARIRAAAASPARVAGRHRDRGAVRGERPGRLLAQPGGRAGDEDPLAGEIDAGEHVVGGGLVVEGHGRSLAHVGGRVRVRTSAHRAGDACVAEAGGRDRVGASGWPASRATPAGRARISMGFRLTSRGLSGKLQACHSGRVARVWTGSCDPVGDLRDGRGRACSIWTPLAMPDAELGTDLLRLRAADATGEDARSRPGSWTPVATRVGVARRRTSTHGRLARRWKTGTPAGRDPRGACGRRSWPSCCPRPGRRGATGRSPRPRSS